MRSNNKFIAILFFGNYFYAFCAIALSIEAALQQHFPLNHLLYYILLFTGSVYYYTKAYVTEITDDVNNKRSVWYVTHFRLTKVTQTIFLLVTLICCLFVIIQNWRYLLSAQLSTWLLLLLFPIVAILYYGINSTTIGNYNLRNTGWLKPFVIGFVWAGFVTIYPMIYYSIIHQIVYEINVFNCLLFLKNFMFITVLCIMFDIKDYATDYNQQLKTFVVSFGLRKTIFYILIPLCMLGLGSFLLYGFNHHFHVMRIILNTAPFVLLLTVAYSMHKRQSILYYLAIIDGLMLVKAICGITAILFFNEQN
jgi:hypothetical protein